MAQGPTAPTGGRAGWPNRNHLLKLHKVPRPRVALSSFFMASGCSSGSTVAMPVFASTANLKTRTRRLQRKHTEASYRCMKEKLLRIVQPLPKAAYASDLEEFRHALYCKDDHGPMSFMQPCINQCAWCGIWTPLPIQPTIITTEVEESLAVTEQPLFQQLGQPTIITTEVKEMIALTEQPLFQQLDAVDTVVDALLERCLCQAPCELETMAEAMVPWILDEHHGIHGQSDVKVAVAAASTTPGNREPFSKLKRYCFKRTQLCEVPEAVHNSWASPPISPDAPQYYTEESTGECKTQ